MRMKLTLAIGLLFAAACAHMTVPPPGPPPIRTEMLADSTHCPGGNGKGNSNGPVICIDANTLAANPEDQHVHRGAWVHFYMTDANEELDIDFKEPIKVEFKGRQLNQAWVRVKDDAALGNAGYTAINLTTGQRKDPTIIIDP